jgi:2-polyprenyl-3-methyl-5-hydroxy-6-metoxy-1,4-benzoquinol methylase
MNAASSVTLGKHLSESWTRDPKHLVFTLSRYKFISKMFVGFKNVLEVGAGDGFGSRIVSDSVKNLDLTDNEILNLKYYDKTNIKSKYFLHDFCKSKLKKKYDGIYLLDVIEHINKKDEISFIQNITSSLNKNGILIIGTPSLESQKYASPTAKIGHINCKNAKELKKLSENFFERVFIFSMNDEVLHTGFHPMSHYIFSLCTLKKRL